MPLREGKGQANGLSVSNDQPLDKGDPMEALMVSSEHRWSHNSKIGNYSTDGGDTNDGGRRAGIDGHAISTDGAASIPSTDHDSHRQRSDTTNQAEEQSLLDDRPRRKTSETSVHLCDMRISQRLASSSLSSSVSLPQLSSYDWHRDRKRNKSGSSGVSSLSFSHLPSSTAKFTESRSMGSMISMSRRQTSSVYNSQDNQATSSEGSSTFEKSLCLSGPRTQSHGLGGGGRRQLLATFFSVNNFPVPKDDHSIDRDINEKEPVLPIPPSRAPSLSGSGNPGLIATGSLSSTCALDSSSAIMRRAYSDIILGYDGSDECNAPKVGQILRSVTDEPRIAGQRPAIPGIWSRFPSHTRTERSSSAGPGDNVLIRDFAKSTSPTDRGNASAGLLLSRPKKIKKNMKSRSMTFGRNVLYGIGRLYRTHGTDYKLPGTGHRSSVATGGSLEYPELEVVPSASLPWSWQSQEAAEGNAMEMAKLDKTPSTPIAAIAPANRRNSIDARVWSDLYKDCVALAEGREDCPITPVEIEMQSSTSHEPSLHVSDNPGRTARTE